MKTILQFITYVARNIVLIATEIAGRIPRVLISSFGILFLICVLIIFISLRSSVKEYLEKRIFDKLAINEIKVTPLNRVETLQLNLGGGESKNAISPQQLKKIKKIAGIKNMQRVIRLNLPASIKAGQFGMQLRTDIFISGVEKEFFKTSSGVDWKNFKAKEYVPVIVPQIILDMYNNFASATGLPEVGERVILGFPLEISIGKSYTTAPFLNIKKMSGEAMVVQGRIFGFNATMSAAGIIVPAEFIRSICADLGMSKDGYSTIMLIIKVKNNTDLPAVVKGLQRLGLKVESSKDIAEKTYQAVKFIDATFILVLALILILTVVAIFNSYLAIVYSRSYEISLKRMLGASKMRIILLFLIEALIVGLLYGIIGYYAGSYSLAYLSKYAPRWIPLLKDLSITLQKGNLLHVAILVSMAVSTLSALVPAIFASNLNLFDRMKKYG